MFIFPSLFGIYYNSFLGKPESLYDIKYIGNIYNTRDVIYILQQTSG